MCTKSAVDVQCCNNKEGGGGGGGNGVGHPHLRTFRNSPWQTGTQALRGPFCMLGSHHPHLAGLGLARKQIIPNIRKIHR